MSRLFSVGENLLKINSTNVDILSVKHNNETLISGEAVYNIFSDFYYSFVFFCSSFTLIDSSELATVFSRYNSRMSENLKKSLDAFNTEYNPLENYDKNEEITYTFGETKEIFSKGEQTNKTITGESHGMDIYSESTYEQDTFVNKNKSESNIDERTDTMTDGQRSDNRTISSYQNVTKNRTHGNIGVTTSQQMLESELEMRKHDIIFDYIKDFADKYFFIVQNDY